MRRGLFEIGLYALATLLVAGSNFLSVPLILHLLGQEGFARWALLEPLILMALPIAGFGVQIGLLNLLPAIPDAAERLFPLHLGAAALVAVLSFGPIASGFGILIGLLAAAIILFEGAIVFFVSYLRAQRRPLTFAGVEGGRSASLLLALLALTLIPLPWVSDVASYLVLRALVGGVFLAGVIVLTRWRWRPDLDLGRQAVRYGGPIVLASMGVSLLVNLDRYAVDWVSGRQAVAGYVAHGKVTQILASALAPFFTWFAPVAIARLQQGGGHAFFARSFFGFWVVAVALAVGLWISAPALWPLIFPTLVFRPEIFAPLILGVILFAAGNPLSVGSLREGSTGWALAATALAGCCGLLFVLVLAPFFGTVGIAWAKAGAMMTYALTFAAHTRTRLGVRYPWGSVGLVGLAGLVLCWILPQVLPAQDAVIGTLVASLAALAILAAGWLLDRSFRPERGP